VTRCRPCRFRSGWARGRGDVRTRVGDVRRGGSHLRCGCGAAGSSTHAWSSSSLGHRLTMTMGLAALLKAIDGWRHGTRAGCPLGVLGFDRDQRASQGSRFGGDTAAPVRPHPGVAGRGVIPWRHRLVPHRCPQSVVDSTRPPRTRLGSRACSCPCCVRFARLSHSNQAGMAPRDKVPLGAALHRHQRLLLLDVSRRPAASSGEPGTTTPRPRSSAHRRRPLAPWR
jgi:hypothetical protein